MRRLLSSCWSNHEGQDLVEYALLLLFIALVVATVIPAIATALNTFFGGAGTWFS